MLAKQITLGRVLLLLLVPLLFVSWSLLTIDPSDKSDLKAWYLMAHAIADGVDPYTSIYALASRWDTGGVGFAHPSPYPVFAGWFALPLALMPFPHAVVAWLGLELLALTVGAWCWCRLRYWPVWAVPVLVIGLLGWFPVAMDLRVGQWSVVLTSLALGCWLALEHERPVLGGTCLGLMVLLKLAGIPVLLWLAWKRQWDAVGTTVAVVLAAHGLAVVVHGWPVVAGYYTTIGPQVAAIYRDSAVNLSMWRLGSMVPVAWLGLLLVLAIRARRVDTSLPLLFGGGIFLSPVAWTHSFVMALMAIGVLASRLLSTGWLTNVAVTAFVLVSVPEVFVLAAPWILAVAMVTLLGLLVWSDRYSAT